MNNSETVLTRPSEVRALLERLNFHPSRSLGQNFLIDANILGIILDAACLRPDDQVLEIGAGLGVLTRPMARRVRRVIAVEKDRRLWAYLSEAFQGIPNVELICADALALSCDSWFESGITKLVSNLPYSVGCRILIDLLKSAKPPRHLVVTLQMEVARRLVAGPGSKDFGLLSLWSQADYDVSIRKTVSPSCFFPAPVVTSAIVTMVRRDQPAAPIRNRAFFYAMTKHLFGHRRKQLKSLFQNMPPEWKLSAADACRVVESLGMDVRSRPETISVAQWCRLAGALYRGEIS